MKGRKRMMSVKEGNTKTKNIWKFAICFDFGGGAVRTRACWMIKDGRIRPNSPSLMTKEATIVYIYKQRTAVGREIYNVAAKNRTTSLVI